MPTPRSTHHRPKPRGGSGGPRPRSRYWWALSALPVLAGVGIYLAITPGGAATQAQDRVTVVHPSQPAAAKPGAVTDIQSSSRCSAEGVASTGSGNSAVCSVGALGLAKLPGDSEPMKAHPRPSATSATPSAAAPAPMGGSPSSPAMPSAMASAPASGGGDQQGEPADQVLALINQARSQAGLAALTFSAGLDQSASEHNLTMAAGCGLSHQCPGEPAIGDRETAAGVHWTAAGENIGDEGPVAADTAAIAQAGVALTQDMLNEQPPNDGHRLNILSTSYAHIGIAVYRDSSGTVWLTQDFSN
jgi:uncharacterized protein YkwD